MNASKGKYHIVWAAASVLEPAGKNLKMILAPINGGPEIGVLLNEFQRMDKAGQIVRNPNIARGKGWFVDLDTGEQRQANP